MKKTTLFWISLVLILSPFNLVRAQEPFIGEIKWVGFTFCPRGWMEADGQVMQINRNEALFSLFGTTYGGDGRITFNLPDLRGRVSIHTGLGPGLTDHIQGNAGGSESETLTASQAPTHNHEINISSSDATYSDGANGVLGTAASNSNGKKKPQLFIYDGPGTADQTLSAESVSDAGDGESHNNLPPYTTLRACVALVGIYPLRE